MAPRSTAAIGKAIECIAEDPGSARIIGLPVQAITTATWAVGGAAAALAGLLYIHLNSLDSFSLTFVLISSLVAAVLGGFNSLGLAVAGSLGLGIAFSFGQGYVDTAGVPDAVVFAASAGHPGPRSRAAGITRRQARVLMRAVLRRPATLRTALSVALAVVAVGWPFVLPDVDPLLRCAVASSYALVALSLTVLYRLGGADLVVPGGVPRHRVCSWLRRCWTHGVPLPLVLVAAGLVGAAVSLVIGIPSLRLRGVYLAVVTLAFGAAAEKYFFPLRGYDADPVARPTILGMSTATDRNLYLVALIVLAVALFIAANLRRSDVGRALFAIRDSEEAAMAMGIRIARYKVGAFALSAAFATTAGVLYAMLFLSTPSPSQFGVLQSFFLLALPVIGGLETLAGPIVGGVIMGTSQPMVDAFHLRLFLVSGLLLVGVTLARSDGLVGLVQRLVRSAREELAPHTVAVHGSFLPADTVSAEVPDRPARIRVRASGPVTGSRVRFRLRSTP